MPFWQLSMLILTGFAGWMAQEGISKAVQLEKAGRVAVFNYLQIVVCFIFDGFYLGRKIHWTDIVGTILVLCFTFVGSVSKCFRKTESNSSTSENKHVVQYEMQEVTQDSQNVTNSVEQEPRMVIK